MGTNREIIKLEKEGWYQSLIEDCRAIIVERTFNSRIEDITGKWELGDRILQDEDKGITKALHTCAVDLKKGERDLWYCIEFRRTYPNFKKEIKNWGKNISWISIKRELTEPKKEIDLSKITDAKIDLRLGDFRKVIKTIKNNSIDLILTDPPYPKKYLSLWTDLSREAKRVLRPSGFLITYAGQLYLPEVMNRLGGELSYYWLGAVEHKGRIAQRFEVNMFNRIKPILFYQKSPKKPQKHWTEDLFVSDGQNKRDHEWGQNKEPFKKILKIFTEPKALVLDPFFGGGAIIDACAETKRDVIGIEIDKKAYNKVKKAYATRKNKLEGSVVSLPVA